MDLVNLIYFREYHLSTLSEIISDLLWGIVNVIEWIKYILVFSNDCVPKENI